MKRTRLSLALLLALLIAALLSAPSLAADQTVTEGAFTADITDGEATITAWNAQDSYYEPLPVTIPAAIGGAPVTAIADEVFMDRYVSSVTFPETLRSIGNKAFYGAPLSGVVHIPASVESIGIYAFGYTTGVTAFDVAEGNANYISPDGVLYSADRSTLWQYPLANPRTSYEVYAATRVLYCTSFARSQYLKTLTVYGYNVYCMTYTFYGTSVTDVWLRSESRLYSQLSPTSITTHIIGQEQPDDQAEEYVESVYEIVLNREADAEGLAHWTAALRSGTSAGEIVKELFRSEEFRARKLNDEETVIVCYRAMLDRSPSESETANWAALLNDGYSTTKLVAEFVASPEFRAICESYGLTAGKIALSPRDINSNITRFVDRCYRLALARLPDEKGLNEWCEHLLVQDLTPERVAFGFIFSDEALGQGLSNEEYIDMLYYMMLDRRPDAGAENWYLSLASLTQAEVAWARASGERSAADAVNLARQKVYADFAASAEFAIMCANFGF